MNRKYEIYEYYESELAYVIDDIESERESLWTKIKSFFKEFLKLPNFRLV